MITQILLTQTFIMFILMILGLILSKTGLLTEHGSKDMANILLYAVIPCVIIRSYITDFTMEKLYGLLMSAVLAVVAFAVAIAVSYIIYGMRKPIDNFGTAFCNAGFIGIPLVTAVFGNEAAFYVASFASILNLLQWTYGIVIITRRKDMINIKKVFVNPVTISLVIGLFLFITGIKLPGVINSTMAGVAALNTPAAMIVLGYYLSCVRIRDLLLNPSLYLASFVRLIIIPLLTLLVLYIIPAGHGQIGMITLIAAATPVGTSTAIFAQKFGQDYEIIGYDNSEGEGFRPFSEPIITSVSSDNETCAILAAKLLIEKIRVPDSTTTIIRVPTRLTIRKTALTHKGGAL